MTGHTCHTPYCWMPSCAVCASCAACREAYAPAVDLLREPSGDLATLNAAFARVAARLGVRVEADEWVVAGTEPYVAARKDGV